MKALFKTFAVAVAAMAMATPMFAAENTGTSQLGSYTPPAGTISLDYYERGVASMRFSLPVGEPNRYANKFVTLSYEGDVISRVPVFNTKQLSQDTAMSDEWQLTFFLVKTDKTILSGSYEVEFDEGFFLMGEDKTPSEKIIINYFIDGDEFSAYPIPDARGENYKYTELQDFTLTYANCTKVEYNPAVGRQIEIINMFAHGGEITGDDDETITAPEDILPEVTFDGNKVNIHLKQPITAAGTYKIEAVDQVFLLTRPDGTVVPSKDINIFYYIPNYYGMPSIDPMEGEVEYFPGTITLMLPKGQELKNVNEMGVTYLCPLNDDGTVDDPKRNYIARFRAKSIAGVENPDLHNVYLINWDGAKKEIEPAPGNYRLITPESLYSIKNGESRRYVSSMNFDYTVVPYESQVKTITPASGSTLNSLSEIVVEFPEAETVVAQWTNDPSWLQNSLTNFPFYAASVEDNPKAAKFYSTVPVTFPGEYRFTTAPNALIVDGVGVTATATYKVSEETGVGTLSDVEIMPSIFDIYTPQGILVAKDADMKTLNALPAGIYIAAGKKFFIH